jgi:hypothetical protein
MRTALKLMVLVFAAALVVTAMTQPAGAYYDPGANRKVREQTHNEMKLRQLVEENMRLARALEDARERTRRAKEELEELRRKLSNLRNAVVLREKLGGEVAEKQQKQEAAAPEPEPRVESPVYVSPESAANDCAGDSQAETQREPESVESPEASGEKPGVVERFLKSEHVRRMRRFIEEMVLRHCPAEPQSCTPEREVEDAPVEAEKPVFKNVSDGLAKVRERIGDMKSRLESAAKRALASKKETCEKPSSRPSAPQVPKKLRNELLEELREKFRRELKTRLMELKRETRKRVPVKERPRAWF